MLRDLDVVWNSIVICAFLLVDSKVMVVVRVTDYCPSRALMSNHDHLVRPYGALTTTLEVYRPGQLCTLSICENDNTISFLFLEKWLSVIRCADWACARLGRWIEGYRS